MKRTISLAMILFLLFAGCTYASGSDVMLVTIYRNEAWGPVADIGVVMTDGKMYTLHTNDTGSLPYDRAELAGYLKTAPLKSAGELGESELFYLKSCVMSVTDGPVVRGGSACDAGQQTAFAVRYTDGAATCVVLGTAGDDCTENTDPTAQCLYAFLRESFPSVNCFTDDPSLTPAGFQAVPLTEFCGIGRDLSRCTLRCLEIDCEAGPVEAECDLTIGDILAMRVTGKENCLSVTGGTYVYQITDENGEYVAGIEFFHGLLVRSDGMYRVG